MVCLGFEPGRMVGTVESNELCPPPQKNPQNNILMALLGYPRKTVCTLRHVKSTQ